MLTLKSRFDNFKHRNGEICTAEDLDLLHKNVVALDMINMRGNISRGFTKDIATKVIEKLTLAKLDSIVIINDLSFQMYNALTDAGFDGSKIYLAFGKWNKDATPSSDDAVYDLMNLIAKSNFAEQLNIIKLEELFMQKLELDGVIANPPYGAIGANITKKIIDNVDFKEYANLLPANDYKRNKTKDLYNYQSDMEPINDGFADAAVTTHVARIHKTRVNNMTLDEFERSNYIDPQLDKYFAENSKRKHYAIDVAQARPKWTKAIQDAVTVNNSFIIHMRDANHGYIPNDTTKKNLATSVRWNLLKEISLDYLHDNYWQNDTQSVYGFITFKSDLERDNFTDFMLKHGWKFMCKVMKAMCVDCTVAFSKYLPKVDWTRSWTVEEILADYGYDADEIQAVMDDLQNFKGMED